MNKLARLISHFYVKSISFFLFLFLRWNWFQSRFLWTELIHVQSIICVCVLIDWISLIAHARWQHDVRTIQAINDMLLSVRPPLLFQCSWCFLRIFNFVPFYLLRSFFFVVWLKERYWEEATWTWEDRIS